MTEQTPGTTMADNEPNESTMDMEEHEKTFQVFMTATKWSAFAVAVVVAFLICGFALDWPIVPTLIGFLILSPVVAYFLR